MKLANRFVVTIVSIFTAFSLTVNAVSPSYVTSLFSQLSVGSIIENQNILQIYNQLSQIPINIVGKLSGSGGAARIVVAVKDTPQDKKENSKKQQPGNDLSFASSQANGNFTRSQSSGLSGVVCNDSSHAYLYSGCCPGEVRAQCRLFIMLTFMLVFLVTLRRLSLPAPNQFNNIFFNITRPSAGKRIGFFICGGF